MEQKELIQSINKYRKDNNIFKRSITERSEKFKSITYDGPPFASGTPHFGHGITSAMKDAILRYKTMKGYRVNRDRWWDCHGLPVEKAVEKHLGIDGRKDIEEKIWIQNFVEECRKYVSNTSDDRRKFVDHIWRRADMDHAYFTMDLSFMESVLWAFQTMYNKNLVYKWFKVQRYCPSCATTLANNEVNEGYKDRQDPAITIKFKITSKTMEQTYILAWTTTPWTLPSNMFLAVGKDIDYAIVSDKASNERYIIAKNLLEQYYKNADEYALINTMKGEELAWLSYEPLFPYIHGSKIDKKYKDQFFKIITAGFVSTEDGTGIVHVAPWFGIDDFEAVAQFLPREEAKKWLFLPIDEYWEFTDEVPEYKGVRVYEANKDIIQRLKDEKKLIAQKSYNHSYPHCRRCDAPLVSKAVTSRFIKEPELQPLTLSHAQEIWFIPENIKNRFIDTLQSAPDWNLSRNRYRGSPLPIWENIKKDEDRIVIWTLEELFQNTKAWSANITKHIIIRHGETDYNETARHDSYGKAKLNKHGQKQARNLAKILKKQTKQAIIVISPLKRTLETIHPLMEKIFNISDLEKIDTQYPEIQKIYQKLRDEKQIQTYLKNPETQKLFEITKQFYVDFRATEIIVPERQDNTRTPHSTISKPTNEKLTPDGECMDDVFERNRDHIEDLSKKFPTRTIITVTHKDSVISMIKAFKDFNYLTEKYDYSPQNAQINIRYRDNDRNTQVDLHKPYIDNYRFKKWVKEYRRVSEVMDCRFESWSMPFGQVGYTGKDEKKLIYPADFIIEGLDQTRWRFRTLHVVGNAVMWKNSYNNVIINGMILAEDGKKMSKKLKNYPDPEYLFDKYGSDAYRLYMLSSPGVRAEPVKFSEKGVDQIYKDFTAAILNAYKFFETYAQIDKFSYNKPTIYFMRHGEPETTGAEFVEKVLRINPDIIYSSPLARTKETAELIQSIIKEYLGKKIKIKINETIENTEAAYKKIIKKEWGKTVLLVASIPQFETIWSAYYASDEKVKRWEITKLPTYKITNELDKRILAELNNLGIQLEQEMNKYLLDNSTKLVLWFIDKLNNRYIRRSRRRFWAPGMDEDKVSAYHTMFEVLEQYMKISASFAPFIAEHIYLELQKFKTNVTSDTKDSVHLKHLPLPSIHYINEELLSEIETVRRIISLGLFIRSKNRIAVKQPLQQIKLKLE